MQKFAHEHEIELVRTGSELDGGDLLFLVSCSEIISEADRKAYLKVLVVHASDLPIGRGWSPHIWQIVNGENELTVTLFEAGDKVDSGDVWNKLQVQVPSHALWHEINHIIFEAELKLLSFAVEHFHTVEPSPQAETLATYFPRRSPSDSRVNPKDCIESQFDLIRACDPERFPAFFDLHGHRYAIRLEKVDD